MGLYNFGNPTTEDADSVDKETILSLTGTTLPSALLMGKAVKRRDRIVRISQYYIWYSSNKDYSLSKMRQRAMSDVEDESEDIERKHLLNAVYDLYEGKAEGDNALTQFEADLEALAAAYDHNEETR